MKAVVLYESMYGNTHLVANAIAEGLRETIEVVVAPISDADAQLLGGIDLLVVGGPTHAHGMSRANTRTAAVDAARKPASTLKLDPDAEGPGLREWFASLGDVKTRAAAFDTRIDAPAAFTGRASKGITRKLRHHGFEVIEEPESFLVTKDSHLEAQQEAHARSWGTQLAATMAAARTDAPRAP